MRSFLLTLLSCLLPSLAALAIDVKDYRFSHLGREDGLMCQRIFDIRQTNDGAVWWATKGYVQRWNGVQTETHRICPTPQESDASGQVVGLDVDTDGTLYAFEINGSVYRYNAEEEQLEKMFNLREKLGREMHISGILVRDGRVWLGCYEGIYKWEKGALTQLKGSYFVNHVFEVEKRVVFCTTTGIYGLNPDGSGVKTLLADRNIYCGYYDKMYRRAWFGTLNSGIYVFDIDVSPKGFRISKERHIETPRMPVRSFLPVGEETMLIGVDGRGVYQADRRLATTASSLWVDAGWGNQAQLHGNGVYAMTLDKWNNILIGSYSGGVDIARPIGLATSVLKHERLNRQSLVNDDVNSVAQKGDGTLLIGTDQGISAYNQKAETWSTLLTGEVVLNIVSDAQGRWYAATFGSGVYRLDGPQPLRVFANGPSDVGHDFAYRLYPDRDGNMWVGGLIGDLAKVSPDGKVKKYRGLNNVHSMLQLSDGSIAVGTAAGLHIVTKDDRVIAADNKLPDGALAHKYVQDLCAVDDTLWVATDGGGLYCYTYGVQSAECRVQSAE